MQLRDYQSAAVEAVADWARTRPGEHPLVVIPTGGGKTAVMSGLVHMVRSADPSARLLILAHRQELIQQAVATAFRMGVPDVGIYVASLGRKDRHAQLTVASVQSLQRDPYVIGTQDVVLVDEAHLVPNDTDTAFRKTLHAIHQQRPSTLIVGLTATPYRLGSGMLHVGDDRLFSGIAYEVSIGTLLANGYIAPVRPRATAARISTDGIAVRGDFVSSALAERADVDATTRAIVAECVAAFADRRSWLVFACSVKHAEHLAEAFNAAGVTAAAVHGDLSPAARSSLIAAHKSGALRCAVTCELLTTGYDHPEIDALAMARPTKSPGLYYQMVGRGFRRAAGKVDCLVLDFAGNVMRHGPVDTLSDRIVNRGPKESDGIAPAKECDCGAIIPASALVCPECGAQFAQKPPALTKVSDDRPILSTDVAVPKWRDVDGAAYSVNTPRDGRRPTLRVDYLKGFRTVASEWVCVEHDVGSFPHSKALAWWRARSLPGDPPPAMSCVEMFEDNPPPVPTAVCLTADGKFDRIVAYRWPVREQLPRACWSCAHFDTTTNACGLVDATTYDPTVPDDVQPVGCDGWSEMDDAGEFVRAMMGVAA